MSEDPNNAQARAADACDTAVHDGAAVDLAAVFTALPGIDLVLAPDAPRYTMLAATDGRLAATMTTRAGTLGRPLFDVFPDANPDNDAPTGVGNLQASLDTVLRTCAPHRMAMQRYDLQRPDGTWEERYWAPLNVPVLGPDGAVRYLVHRVDDVTDAVRLAAERDRLRGAVAGSERARASAEATRDAVTIANAQLHEQALELELANRQLQDQAADLAASEMRFRAVEDASPDAVLLLRPIHDAGGITDFDFVYGNPVAGRMLGGGTLDGLVGRRMLDVFPNSEAEGYFGAYVRVFATGVPYTREDRYTRDGLDVGVRVTAVRAGDLLHLRHEDIAARLHAEAERARLVADLQAERARLADIVRLAPTFTAVLRGPDHIIELTNAGFDALVGGRDVQGRTVVDALPETAAQGFVTLLDGVLATGTPFAGREVRYQRPGADGAAEVRYIDFVCQALADADGTRSGVFVHGVDVTDQVRARQEVERLLAASERARAEAEAARAEAQAANQAKSEFLATMSHELRTPLNAIGGYAQLIDLGLAGPVTPQQRDYLTRLTASGQHLLGLVNDVLDLAKVDAGELRVARDRATTDEAVAAALDLVEPQGTTRGVGLVDGTPGARVTYAGDAHRVRQVLVNLLSNAVKFTEAGGTVTVTCGLVAAAPPAARVSGGGPWASVCVADTGIGIVPAEQAAVFEPFHQVEQGRTRTRGGTGLGLAISRRLARLMGGDLTLESRPGVGSAFTLWLPAAGGAGERDNEVVETSAARVMRAAPGVVRGLGALGTLLRRQVDEVVETYAERLRVEPGAPLARGMRQAELEDHLVTALADLAQSLVIVGEAGTAETGLLADSVAINTAVAERHGARRFAQGWDVTALRHDYAVLREVLARAVRADARASGAHAGGADAEAALAILLGFVEQSEARGVTAWQAAHAAAEGEM